MVTAATRVHAQHAEPNGGRLALGRPKRSANSSSVQTAALRQAAEKVFAGGHRGRGAKARISDSVLRGLRQVVDLAEKSSRTTDDVVQQPPNAQLREDYDFIVQTLNKLGQRFQLAPVASVPRKTAAKLGSPAKAIAISPTKGEYVLSSNEELIGKGQLLDARAFQELMGWSTRQALSKAVQTNRVFYVTHKAERYFPAFYGDSALERSHLETVSRILGDLPGGSKLQFFLAPKRSLDGQTPLQALAAGRFSKVKDIASAFAEVPVGAG